MSDDERGQLETEFCQRLEKLEAGDQARLRRAVGKTMAEATDTLGLFYQLLPYGVPTTRQPTYFLVATLYPLVDAGGKGDLGQALRSAVQDANRKGLDRRMVTLLDADETQLPFRLRQAVHYLQGQRVRLDWPQLLQDLLQWNHPNRFVQQQWARSYFSR
jgi:CRISPR system Cascade subunit CasB